MNFLTKLSVGFAVFTAAMTVLFYASVDVRHTLCFAANLGYLDWMGNEFLDSATKCMAETSTYYLKRDFQAGQGKRLPIAEMDCTKGEITFETIREGTQDFTRPFVCRGLLKGNKCRDWTLDYFREKSTDEDFFRVQLLDVVEGNRRSFMRHTYPQFHVNASETYNKLSRGEQIYVSFDNYFIRDHPDFLSDLNLAQYFPEVKWILHTLFISNFSVSTMGSPFHAAPNDNFFFQCLGRKHWFFVSPHELKYTSAYVANGVTFVSNHIDENLIVDRIPMYETIVEEGDMMYNPPYWLHAVGTVPGLTVSIANRAWREIIPKNTNYYYDAMYKLGFPAFASSVIWQKVVSKFSRITSLTLQDSLKATVLNGGALKVVEN